MAAASGRLPVHDSEDYQSIVTQRSYARQNVIQMHKTLSTIDQLVVSPNRDPDRFSRGRGVAHWTSPSAMARPHLKRPSLRLNPAHYSSSFAAQRVAQDGATSPRTAPVTMGPRGRVVGATGAGADPRPGLRRSRSVGNGPAPPGSGLNRSNPESSGLGRIEDFGRAGPYLPPSPPHGSPLSPKSPKSPSWVTSGAVLLEKGYVGAYGGAYGGSYGGDGELGARSFDTATAAAAAAGASTRGDASRNRSRSMPRTTPNVRRASEFTSAFEDQEQERAHYKMYEQHPSLLIRREKPDYSALGPRSALDDGFPTTPQPPSGGQNGFLAYYPKVRGLESRRSSVRGAGHCCTPGCTAGPALILQNGLCVQHSFAAKKEGDSEEFQEWERRLKSSQESKTRAKRSQSAQRPPTSGQETDLEQFLASSPAAGSTAAANGKGENGQKDQGAGGNASEGEEDATDSESVKSDKKGDAGSETSSVTSYRKKKKKTKSILKKNPNDDDEASSTIGPESVKKKTKSKRTTAEDDDTKSKVSSTTRSKSPKRKSDGKSPGKSRGPKGTSV